MFAEGTLRTYNHIGVSDSFHPVSHHSNDMGRIEKLIKIQTWHVERFAAFLGKLATVPDGDGTLLDHSLLLYGSNMSNSDRHNGHPLPTFFFQAEDGIRDKLVTGVQTCALPIFHQDAQPHRGLGPVLAHDVLVERLTCSESEPEATRVHRLERGRGLGDYRGVVAKTRDRKSVV